MDELSNLQNFLGDALIVDTVVPPVPSELIDEVEIDQVELQKDVIVVPNTTADLIDDGDDDFNTQVEQFKALVGYDGDIKDFTVETIGEIVKSKIDSAQQEFNKIIDDSEVLAFAEHKKNGGTLDSFKSQPLVFDKSLLSFENDDHVEHVFITYFKQIKGLDDDDVELAIAALKSNPQIIESKFNKVLDEIESITNKEIERYNKVQEDSINKNKEVFKNLITTIDSGEYGVIKLTDKKEIANFKTYLNSELYNKKWEDIEKDPTKTAIIEYLVYNDFNLDSLTKNANVIAQKRNVVGLIKTAKRETQKLDEFDEVLGMLNNI